MSLRILYRRNPWLYRLWVGGSLLLAPLCWYAVRQPAGFGRLLPLPAVLVTVITSVVGGLLFAGAGWALGAIARYLIYPWVKTWYVRWRYPAQFHVSLTTDTDTTEQMD